ncbi:MAG TPA: signal recognition particle-docking protein FtsY [Chitinivibrionales bacterium]|nr:signal recognition particle-docking protein FtsY [Chitinivibrionales bacterium]
MNIFTRLKEGLSKTRNQIASIVSSARGRFDEEFYETLEDALVSADVGYDCSTALIERLKKEISEKGIVTPEAAYAALKAMLAADLTVSKSPVEFSHKPWVVLVVGVNGVGKTTTIGKLAREYYAAGKKVMFAAADTFRAGAIEQLRIWAQRTNSEIITQKEGADPASVAFDAMEASKARGIDVLLLDTAGRLHNKANLMNELEKIVRVIKRNSPGAPNEVLLVVDATTGQNALAQAKVFNEITSVTGFVITKLDGTAKGGIAVTLAKNFGIPVRKIGVGEGPDDLQDFDPAAYVEAMFGDLGAAQTAPAR